MMAIASIVEGHGEVTALPALLRRLNVKLSPEVSTEIITPIRVHRDKFLNKDTEFTRYLKLAESRCGASGWILILLDADDDCPAERSAEILAAARKIVSVRTSVVMANKEYEAWFIAAALSLHGKRGFVFDGEQPTNSDDIRDAKGWISGNILQKNYREITDQPAFSAIMDVDLVRNYSRSFRKLCSEWEQNIK